MPTEIKVILPTPGFDDVLSIADAFSTTEDNCSILDGSTLDYDADIETTDNNEKNENITLPAEPVQNSKDENIRNVNDINLTPTKSASSNESKSVHQINVADSHSVNTNSTDSKCVNDELTRRIRSAKIEQLFKKSNRESLVSSVRDDAFLHQPNQESAVNSVRNSSVQRPRSSNQYHSSSRITTSAAQKYQPNQKKRNNLPRVESKSCQTNVEDGSEETCKADERPEIQNVEGVKKTAINTKVSPKRQMRPSSSPARLRQRPSSPKPRPVNNVKLSITGTYDIELEHRDIMTKALNSYHQHRHRDKPSQMREENGNLILNYLDDMDDKKARSKSIGGSERHNHHSLFRNSSLLRDILASVGESTDRERRDSTCSSTTNTPRSSSSVNNNNNRIQLIYDDDKLVSRIWTDEKNRQEASKRTSRSTNYIGLRGKDRDVNSNRRPASAASSFDRDKTFKLARCRLIYNEVEPKKPKGRPKSSYTRGEQANRVIGDNTSGVLVDSVGHVYGRSKPRPLSALPSKFHTYLQERSRTHYLGDTGGWHTERRYYT